MNAKSHVLVVDDEVAFVGGINIIDDCLDLHHGRFDTPRLDYAVRVEGPIVQPIAHTCEQTWLRTALRNGWRDEVREIAEQDNRFARLGDLLERALSAYRTEDVAAYGNLAPTRAAFVVRGERVWRLLLMASDKDPRIDGDLRELIASLRAPGPRSRSSRSESPGAAGASSRSRSGAGSPSSPEPDSPAAFFRRSLSHAASAAATAITNWK